MKRALAAMALVLLLSLPSGAAEQRERIPDGCRELATQAGLPLSRSHGERGRRSVCRYRYGPFLQTLVAAVAVVPRMEKPAIATKVAPVPPVCADRF